MSKPKRLNRKPVKHERVYNIYHPDLSDKIEPAFKSKGVQYYNFIKDTQIRTGRYMVIQNFLQEVHFRMDLTRLKAYIKRIKEEIDGSKGNPNVGNACVFLSHMETLTELAFEPETVYRLASAIYFDDTEDLRTWDFGYNTTKIRAWKENGTLDFFYGRPLIELTGLSNISEIDIINYLEKVDDLTKKYSSVLQSQ